MTNTMRNFKSHITESKPLRHITHIEDLPLFYGPDGLDEAISFLKRLYESTVKGLEYSNINLSVKFDGSPSIVFGTDPKSGKFFVGTKAVFNTTKPLINYTYSDIDKNHQAPGLRYKLKVALKYLPELKLKGIYQGDVLYTHIDLKKQVIDKEEYYTFRPNALTYAVPAKSELGKDIISKRFGLVIHTKYEGKDLQHLTPNLHFDSSDIKSSKDVWARDTSIEPHKEHVKLDKEFVVQEQKILNKITSDSKKLQDDFLRFISKNKVSSTISQFENLLIKLGNSYKPKEMVDKLLSNIKSRYHNDAKNLKTVTGRTKKLEVGQNIIDYLTTNRNQLELLYNVRNSIVDFKLLFISNIKKLQAFQTFINNIHGDLEPTDPEGLVVSDSDNVVKLIDRQNFSKFNFNIPKDWDSE